MGLAGGRHADDRRTFVPPVVLRRQVGLPRQDGVAKLGRALKGDNDLCIHLHACAPL